MEIDEWDLLDRRWHSAVEAIQHQRVEQFIFDNALPDNLADLRKAVSDVEALLVDLWILRVAHEQYRHQQEERRVLHRARRGIKIRGAKVKPALGFEPALRPGMTVGAEWEPSGGN